MNRFGNTQACVSKSVAAGYAWDGLCLLGPIRRGLHCRRVFESSEKSSSGVLVRLV